MTVGYSLRLKEELGRDNTWVAAYTNDVCASARRGTSSKWTPHAAAKTAKAAVKAARGKCRRVIAASVPLVPLRIGEVRW